MPPRNVAPEAGHPAPPVLLVVDAGDGSRETIERALVRRFAPDYDVLTADSADAGLATLERLAADGRDVALAAADLHLPGLPGVDFLERARAIHSDATRVLLVEMDRFHTRVPLSEFATVQRATALGRVDFAVVKGWVTPEEWFYPRVQEALTAWTTAHRPAHVVYRIVGEQWSPASYAVRDLLTRNGVPFEFHAVDSPRGRELADRFAIDPGRLPALIHDNGAVLHDPSFAEIARSHGIATAPESGEYDLVVWAPDRPAWRPVSTARRRACTRWSSSRTRSADRRVPAR